MPEDLNAMNLPSGIQAEREIFEPENAWPGASGRVILQTNKLADGVYQAGYDPESGTYWLRTGRGGAWGDWTQLPEPPDPPAGDEYETRVMTPKRGPGRPRKDSAD